MMREIPKDKKECSRCGHFCRLFADICPECEATAFITKRESDFRE